jgi:hypothetical protein
VLNFPPTELLPYIQPPVFSLPPQGYFIYESSSELLLSSQAVSCSWQVLRLETDPFFFFDRTARGPGAGPAAGPGGSARGDRVCKARFGRLDRIAKRRSSASHRAPEMEITEIQIAEHRHLSRHNGARVLVIEIATYTPRERFFS